MLPSPHNRLAGLLTVARAGSTVRPAAARTAAQIGEERRHKSSIAGIPVQIAAAGRDKKPPRYRPPDGMRAVWDPRQLGHTSHRLNMLTALRPARSQRWLGYMT